MLELLPCMFKHLKKCAWKTNFSPFGSKVLVEPFDFPGIVMYMHCVDSKMPYQPLGFVLSGPTLNLTPKLLLQTFALHILGFYVVWLEVVKLNSHLIAVPTEQLSMKSHNFHKSQTQYFIFGKKDQSIFSFWTILRAGGDCLQTTL